MLRFLAITTLLLAGAAGCVHERVEHGPLLGSVVSREGKGAPGGLALNAVAIAGDSLAKRVEVVNHAARHARDGRLVVMVALKNSSGAPILAEGRALFFDIERRPAGSEPGWRKVALGPKAMTLFRQASEPRKDIGYYHVEIREVK